MSKPSALWPDERSYESELFGARVTEQLNRAPLTVTAPDGNVYNPARLLILDDQLTVEDREGNVLASDTVVHLGGGTRIISVDAVGGTWHARSPCGCNASGRAALREWEEGS